MTTEHERLIEWMERNGHDAGALKKKRRLSHMDKVRFGMHFGPAAMLEVFGVDITKAKGRGGRAAGIDKNGFIRGLESAAWRPDHSAAHRAITIAIKNGEMPPAKAYKCCGCDAQAVEYHHPSYLPSDRLNVVPLCRKCHRRIHCGHEIPFGVVPTAVGVVRIAISNP